MIPFLACDLCSLSLYTSLLLLRLHCGETHVLGGLCHFLLPLLIGQLLCEHWVLFLVPLDSNFSCSTWISWPFTTVASQHTTSHLDETTRVIMSNHETTLVQASSVEIPLSSHHICTCQVYRIISQFWDPLFPYSLLTSRMPPNGFFHHGFSLPTPIFGILNSNYSPLLQYDSVLFSWNHDFRHLVRFWRNFFQQGKVLIHCSNL